MKAWQKVSEYDQEIQQSHTTTPTYGTARKTQRTTAAK